MECVCGHDALAHVRQTGRCHLCGCAEVRYLDVAEGARRREEGIARAEAHAPDGWVDRAADVLYRLAREQETVIADDLWIALGDDVPHETRAAGAVWRRAAREGWLERTPTFVKSARPSTHRMDIPVWRSLVYAGSRKERA
jgi:hypothetical protein